MGALDDFAEAHALGPAPELPHEGGLLGEDDVRIEAAATGPLPGGIEGTLAHLSYTYRSDDSTKTRRLTTVVARRRPDRPGRERRLRGLRPGPSARLLDSCGERLASEMRAAQSARATRTATAST